MKNNLFILFAFLIAFSTLSAQKVGLVLSGGGAKGIIHIGVIKALEENNIPFDYVAGTSMGAVVGGMYSMGLSPDEMIAILKSDDFKNWSSGQVEPKYVYYYLNSDPRPSIIDFPLRIHRLDSIRIKPNFLPTNLVSPHQMNFAFVPLFAQANAVANGNFDQLFIPFRCVASDIYRKEAVVFRQGVLGDAIRASMTYPFMFKPITIDNRLLFDGGIFNNFPVDVMRDHFDPGIIIGSNVSSNPEKPDETNLVRQIENMIINRSDQNITKYDGILFNFKNNDITGFDFNKVDELVKIGYDSTLHYLDEIKARIARRVPFSELTERRNEFRKRFPELKFQNVEITGIDSLKRKYIEQIFHYKNEEFTMNDFKEGYYKLISDDKILEVIPHAIYNPALHNFDLHLKVKIRDRLKVHLGGNISSSTSNQAYFGLTYQNLKEFAQTAYIDAQFGKMYNGFGIGSRIEAPTKKNWYMKLGVVVHNFDYFEGTRLFFADYRTANFSQYEA
ncbi:MAG TPA: patatin-like phospholipase family protein, partial [Paludibacter sp.]|nr:patatin-like phospholipase family protein [Paludibacter sp.]